MFSTKQTNSFAGASQSASFEVLLRRLPVLLRGRRRRGPRGDFVEGLFGDANPQRGGGDLRASAAPDVSLMQFAWMLGLNVLPTLSRGAESNQGF